MPLLRAVWAGWVRIAHAIGRVQSRVVLTVLYFVLLGPFALGVRLLADPLQLRRRPGGSHWLPRAASPASLEAFRKQ
ncbi:MAG TPA: SxtJ family membrane protein [Methylomirabilota bacterium]|jgi:hypothetical protein|nr:SxtJ family membrane protein [Methylomirabilota bacterium]